MSPTKVLWISGLFCALSSQGLGAQTVRGSVLSDATGQGVQGALVFLEDENGERLQGTLANASGAFLIRAPAPGRYRLRAQRIGFDDGLSAAFDLGPADAVDRTISMRERAIELGEIVVQARRRCMVRPTAGLALAQLWDDARKALEATSFTEDQRIYGYSIRRYRRTLDATTMRVVRDTSVTTRTSGSASPYASRPLDALLTEGFIGEGAEGVRYFAPDAQVLLSDGFADAYCLRVELQDPDVDGVIGIGFEPAGRTGPPAIRGTLWLDRESYELRWLDFGYARAHLPFAEDPRIGGRVDFEAMPDGSWIVRRWHLRVPADARARLRGNVQQPSRESVLTQILEEGGEVLEARSGSGLRRLADRGIVEGSVYDSARAGALPGARVFLSGTNYAATTDSRGRFLMEAVPEGVYEIGFTHPDLESLKLHPAAVPVTVARGEASQVELALAASARADAVTRICAADADHQGESTGVLWGRVTEESTGAPVPGATLEISWRRIGGRPDEERPDQISVPGLMLSQETVTVESDTAGSFLVCGLPGSNRLDVRATHADRQGEFITVGPLEEEEIVEREVPLP